MDRDRQNWISDTAAFWDARLRAPGCTDGDRQEFNSWRAADPAHRAAFERLQTIVAGLRNEMSRADLRSMRDAALALVDRRKKRLTLAAAAGIAASAVVAVLWYSLPQGAGFGRNDAASYTTGIGQRSTVTLQDGSSLELNSKTRVEVAFTSERRSVKLLDGQAIFRVARNPARPFVVHAGDRDIVAIGTAFDVRLERAALRVTLLEGKVAVAPEGASLPLLNMHAASSSSQNADRERARTDLSGAAESSEADSPATVFLSPGQQLVVARSIGERPSPTTGREEISVRSIDVAKVTSWREGRVFLEDLALADAVAEMNRHSAIQIAVSDPTLERLRVNGMFRAGEQQTFASALEEYFPIVAERRGETEIMLRRRR